MHTPAYITGAFHRSFFNRSSISPRSSCPSAGKLYRTHLTASSPLSDSSAVILTAHRNRLPFRLTPHHSCLIHFSFGQSAPAHPAQMPRISASIESRTLPDNLRSSRSRSFFKVPSISPIFWSSGPRQRSCPTSSAKDICVLRSRSQSRRQCTQGFLRQYFTIQNRIWIKGENTSMGVSLPRLPRCRMDLHLLCTSR